MNRPPWDEPRMEEDDGLGRVDIGARVDRIGRKSFDMSFAVHACAGGRLVAEGSCVNVAYDYGAGQTIEIPDEFRRLAAAYEGKPLG